jgi:hypothetical protein
MPDTEPRSRAADWWDVTRRRGSERDRPRLFERDEPKSTDAWKQLLRCLGADAGGPLPSLSTDARRKLADNRPVDPNDSETWSTRSDHVSAVLLRHEVDLSSWKVSDDAGDRLIERQRAADRDAGLDWTTVTTPADALNERLATARASGIDADDPQLYAYQQDKARAVARRHKLDVDAVDDLARYALAAADRFDADGR